MKITSLNIVFETQEEYNSFLAFKKDQLSKRQKKNSTLDAGTLAKAKVLIDAILESSKVTWAI